MGIEVIVQLVFTVLSIGIVYGSFNTRVKAIETKLDDQKNIGERLARIEEQTKLLLEHFINKV
jgi:hypothetical protein